MTEKKIVKRNARQKKLSRLVEEVTASGPVNYEANLKNQLRVIQKDYNRLLTDVSKGYNLFKTWVEVQAVNTREVLRTRFTERMGR